MPLLRGLSSHVTAQSRKQWIPFASSLPSFISLHFLLIIIIFTKYCLKLSSYCHIQSYFLITYCGHTIPGIQQEPLICLKSLCFLSIPFIYTACRNAFPEVQSLFILPHWLRNEIKSTNHCVSTALHCHRTWSSEARRPLWHRFNKHPRSLNTRLPVVFLHVWQASAQNHLQVLSPMPGMLFMLIFSHIFQLH